MIRSGAFPSCPTTATTDTGGPSRGGRGTFAKAFFGSVTTTFCGRSPGKITTTGKLTLRSVKARICELRRHGSWNRAKARQEWDLLARCDHLYSREGFGRWYERTSMDDAGEESVYTHAPQAQGFVTHCLPRLREAIRAELAREKGVTA